jgi:acetolactate synthase I/II/III large subunit
MIVMNDGGYGVIKNIQDAVYGGRHCYVELKTPKFEMLCKSMNAIHFKLDAIEIAPEILAAALSHNAHDRG